MQFQTFNKLQFLPWSIYTKVHTQKLKASPALSGDIHLKVAFVKSMGSKLTEKTVRNIIMKEM